MNYWIHTILAFAPPNPGGEQTPPWVNLVPLVLIMVMFYFVLIRPQQKRAREQAAMIKGLKRGDQVVTTGGIVGVITAVKDRTVSLRSEESKFEVLKSAVGEITQRGNLSEN